MGTAPVPLYTYLGPSDLYHRDAELPLRFAISHPDDVWKWVAATGQELDREHCITATFVVDVSGTLWIADRRSEHVQCARGASVRSAGEITFVLDRPIAVIAVTNQSTGYCPEPASWPAVSAALGQAALPAPAGFTTAFTFRRCTACATLNLVKEDVFRCGVCGDTLPEHWNCDRVR